MSEQDKIITTETLSHFKAKQDIENSNKFQPKGSTDLTGAVRYDAVQVLTDEQKAQARANIGVDLTQGGGTAVSEDEIIVVTNETFNEETMLITISQETADIIANYDGSKPMFLLVKEVGVLIPHTLAGVFSVIQGSHQTSIDLSEGRLSALINSTSLISTDSTNKIPLSYIPKLTLSQLPELGFYDDVVEGYYNPDDYLFYEEAEFEKAITGENGKIYVDKEKSNSYRYSGTIFVRVNPPEYTIATNSDIEALFT